jgi:hypothetical protein
MKHRENRHEKADIGIRIGIDFVAGLQLVEPPRSVAVAILL